MPKFPSNIQVKNHVIEAAASFFEESQDHLSKLPILSSENIAFTESLKLVEIEIPNWASSIISNKKLLVPSELVTEEMQWFNIDWWAAVFILLECWHERNWEEKYGSINSYSNNLKNWDQRAWEKPIVNEILLFLDLWFRELFGVDKAPNVLPMSNLTLTFDLDAISKAPVHTLKHFLFLFYRAFKSVKKLKFNEFSRDMNYIVQFIINSKETNLCENFKSFLISNNNLSNMRINIYVCLDSKRKMFNFYDPRYTVGVELRELLVHILNSKMSVGLHTSVKGANDSELIRLEKNMLEGIIGYSVKDNRNHWLRFSWRDTWSALEGNFFEHDETLMFNDRPGFRNSMSFTWKPWNSRENRTFDIRATPTIFMDSHFYMYLDLSPTQIRAAIWELWEKNNKFNGRASVLWHPHTLSPRYSWHVGFNEVLQILQLNK